MKSDSHTHRGEAKHRGEKKNHPYASRKKNKKGIVADFLPWLIIGIAVLVITAVAIFVLREKGISLIDQLKNLFRA